MSDLDMYLEVSAKIQRGEFDDKLRLISDKVEARLKALQKEITIADFNIGDRVILNDKCGTKYLQGKTGVIVGKKVVKLVMTLDKPTGRYQGKVTVPTHIVDKIAV